VSARYALSSRDSAAALLVSMFIVLQFLYIGRV
jgi:hypothetical protein